MSREAVASSRRLGLIALLALAYALFGAIGSRMAVAPGVASFLWPPSGLALGALWLCGYAVWPGVWLGSAAVNAALLHSLSPRPSLGAGVLAVMAIATFSTLQALVGVRLLVRISGEHSPLDRVREMFRAAVFGVLPASLVSATGSIGALWALGLCPREIVFQNWIAWYWGDCMGIVLFAPAIICWCRRAKEEISRGSSSEALLLLVLALAFGAACFFGWGVFSEVRLPAAIGVFPLVLWGAVRFGQRGATLLVLSFMGLAIPATLLGRGYFAREATSDAMLHLHWFFGAANMTGLALAAAFRERSEALRKLEGLLAEKDQRLQSAEARLKVVVSRAPVVLFALDADGKVLLSEGKGLETLGFEPGELVGASAFDIYKENPDSCEAVRRGLAGDEFQTTLVTGPLGPTMQTSWTPIRDAKGNLAGTIGVSVDITALKKAEDERQALLEETQRQARHLKIVNDASVMFSNATLNYETLLETISRVVSDTFQHGCMIRLRNPVTQALEIAAYHNSDLRAMRAIADLKSKGEALPADNVHWRVMSEARVMILDSSGAIRSDFGSAYESHFDRFSMKALVVLPMRVRGKAIGTLAISLRGSQEMLSAEEQAIVQDIADRAAQAVENSRLYNEAQRVARLREEFVSVASHELRTPITTLKMQVCLLQRILKKGLPASVQESELETLLADSDEQLARLEKLVADLLDVSRLSSGQLALNREHIDLASLARDTVRRLQPELESAKCEIRVNADAPVPGYWDRFRLEQVLTNLLTNAIKFGKARPVDLEVLQGPASTRVVISDRGIGIPKEDQRRIFERFERAVSLRSFGGLGLGLYISSQIVQQHGGTISVESEPGAGSKFVVDLPMV